MACARAVVATAVDGTPEIVDDGQTGLLVPPRDAEALATALRRLLSDGEPYFVLADFAAYAKAQDDVDALYLEPDQWSRKAVLNALSMGTFSSDRSIREYAERIWRIKPVL